ncbi:uncharacterized protein A4U43_C08F8640 [Asparagus officinalis]|uniref:CWF19-like protein 2 n=1 Tax=Asparagus officinalis TaxID=4686 RepID=UPI00098E12BC|nr:CWF19-like protein 2 [Asparagus officinalis]XP_020241161.1 CWF19-like protein 2 [Asparagus officinalis]ONK59634.1 uncharacterized protein A4U43_C08F8640 [Asparagus officinalis]
MLSGIKIIPRDQLNKADSDEEIKSSTKKEKRERKKKDKRRSSRKEREYTLDSDDDGSSSLRSGSESEEERRSTRKRKGRRKERDLEDCSSSDEYEKKKGGKKKERNELSDDGDRGLFSQREKELARKEIGLEWMLYSGRTVDNNAVRNEIEHEEPQVEEVKRTNRRELNPYLKDNGSGYPDDASPLEVGTSQLLSSSVVGDGGASWRLKALKRAREQAAREGRKLDEVVEERWGSLGHLATSVAAHRAAPSHAHLHAIKGRKRGQVESSESGTGFEMKEGTKEAQHASRDYLRDGSSRPEMRKPKQDSLHWKKNKIQNIRSEDRSLISAAISGINKFADDGSFMQSISSQRSKDVDVCISPQSSKEADILRENDVGSSLVRNSNMVPSLNTQRLSANQLAAKVMQLRMKGMHEEAEQLSKEMKTVIGKPATDSEAARQGTETNTSRYFEKQISSQRKKKEEDADLHLAQTIMRNKKYSLSGRADDEYDYDGDAPSRKQNRKKEGKHEEKKTFSKHFQTQQERCQFCFENPLRPKHLVVSIGNFTYMMLPQWQPLVQGHCCILPMQHESSMRTVDKNVWEEVRNFKKCLLRMFSAQDKDVLFIETVIDLARQRRHCLIDCIPIPYAASAKAPMYFKKAIDEAEDEWGQHEMKKVIPTSGNLRNVIPENFSYFHVEFGLDKGFVHVIDDDANFSSSFGLNIVRGMLRLPEEDMHRRRRVEPVDKQKQAVADFAREWAPFDWTKDLD